MHLYFTDNEGGEGKVSVFLFCVDFYKVVVKKDITCALQVKVSNDQVTHSMFYICLHFFLSLSLQS